MEFIIFKDYQKKSREDLQEVINMLSIIKDYFTYIKEVVKELLLLLVYLVMGMLYTLDAIAYIVIYIIKFIVDYGAYVYYKYFFKF